jgi:hypothetical protein
MNTILLILVLIIPLFFLNKKRKSSNGSDWTAFFYVMVTCVSVIVFILFVRNLNVVSSQIDDMESIVMVDEQTEILNRKANELMGEFKLHLGETYPNLEKDIFSKISPESLSVYMVQYPQLRSSETIIELVKQINSLKSNVYDMEMRRAEFKKEIRYRLRSPWNISWFVPSPDPGIF